MTCLTASDLSLLDNLEEKLSEEVSVSLLAELERELLRLRMELSAEEWTTFRAEFPKRRIFEVLRQGNLTLRRLNASDFGFPADVLDVVMANSFEGRPAMAASRAHLISAWEYSLPTSRSVRARQAYFAREISEVIRTAVKPRILILGAGQMREADEGLHEARLQHAEFVAVEADADVSRRLRRSYWRQGLRIEEGGWHSLEGLSPQLGLFDLIYSAAWLDSTDDTLASVWLGCGVEMLRPGGRILAANFSPGSRDAGWVEACWNWRPYYRSEVRLAQLVMDLKEPQVRGHAVFRDESGASAFLEIHSI